MQSEKYELQNHWLTSFCTSDFALFALHFRRGFAALLIDENKVTCLSKDRGVRLLGVVRFHSVAA